MNKISKPVIASLYLILVLKLKHFGYFTYISIKQHLHLNIAFNDTHREKLCFSQFSTNIY